MDSFAPNAQDHAFMGDALDLALSASRSGEVPVGCVVVVDGLVVARGENRRERDHDPSAHAEIVALRIAGHQLESWRLSEATAYVTLEPCVMCAGALLAARVTRVVVGALDEKAGAVGSRYNLLSDPRLMHEASLTYGVRAAEATALLSEFFATRREPTSPRGPIE